MLILKIWSIRDTKIEVSRMVSPYENIMLTDSAGRVNLWRVNKMKYVAANLAAISFFLLHTFRDI